MKPLDRFLAGAEATHIQRLSSEEIDHAFMGRITRVVRNDATVKIDSVFYEVPPEFIGARVDIRFPIANPDHLILYRDDKPVRPIQPVDVVDNARFHAQKVETAYASLAQDNPPPPPDAAQNRPRQSTETEGAS